MQKIVIMGNSGSGKSTCSQQLSKLRNIPVYSLDDFFWFPGGFNKKRSAEDVIMAINDCLKKDQWVIEGVFGQYLEYLLPEADTLIFLDLPWAICKASLLQRGSESSTQLDVDEAEKNFNELLTWASLYGERENKNSRQFHHSLFDQFEKQKIRFTDRTAVNDWLSAIDQR